VDVDGLLALAFPLAASGLANFVGVILVALLCHPPRKETRQDKTHKAAHSLCRQIFLDKRPRVLLHAHKSLTKSGQNAGSSPSRASSELHDWRASAAWSKPGVISAYPEQPYYIPQKVEDGVTACA
jgi:hypothetical protein